MQSGAYLLSPVERARRHNAAEQCTAAQAVLFRCIGPMLHDPAAYSDDDANANEQGLVLSISSLRNSTIMHLTLSETFPPKFLCCTVGIIRRPALQG